MKQVFANSKKIAVSILLLSLVFLFHSCSRKISFQTSQVAPAARGDVKVTRDDNKNYHIKLFVSNLAEVKRLEPPREAYVVWMVSDQNETKNLGKLSSSSGTFSSKLKASFETVSPVKPVKIFITAESDPGVTNPGQIILTTEGF